MMKINYPGSTANTAVQTVTESRMVHAVYRHGAHLDLAPMWLCGAGAGGRGLVLSPSPSQPVSACRSLPETRSQVASVPVHAPCLLFARPCVSLCRPRRRVLRLPPLAPSIGPRLRVHRRIPLSRLCARSKSGPRPSRPSPGTVSRLYRPCPASAQHAYVLVLLSLRFSSSLSATTPGSESHLVPGTLISPATDAISTLAVAQHIASSNGLQERDARHVPQRSIASARRENLSQHVSALRVGPTIQVRLPRSVLVPSPLTLKSTAWEHSPSAYGPSQLAYSARRVVQLRQARASRAPRAITPDLPPSSRSACFRQALHLRARTRR